MFVGVWQTRATTSSAKRRHNWNRCERREIRRTTTFRSVGSPRARARIHVQRSVDVAAIVEGAKVEDVSSKMCAYATSIKLPVNESPSS